MVRQDPNSVEYILLDPYRGPRRVTRRRFYYVVPTTSQSSDDWADLQREAKRVEDRIRELRQIRDVRENGRGSK